MTRADGRPARLGIRLAVLVAFVGGCAICPDSPPARYLERAGFYRIVPPPGWTRIPSEDLGRGHFVEGYRKHPDRSHPYFLVRIRDDQITARGYRAEVCRARELESVSEVATCRPGTWMYLRKYDVFLGRYQYEDRDGDDDVHSVSARKLRREGAVVIHFYWRGESQMREGLRDLEAVVASLTFAE